MNEISIPSSGNGFWYSLFAVITSAWNVLNTDMTIGGLTFSFADVLILGGIVAIGASIIWGLVLDDSDY